MRPLSSRILKVEEAAFGAHVPARWRPVTPSPLLAEGWGNGLYSAPLPTASLPLAFTCHDSSSVTFPTWLILSDCFSRLSHSPLGGTHTPIHSARVSQFLKTNPLFQWGLPLHCSSDTTSSLPSSLWCRLLCVAKWQKPHSKLFRQDGEVSLLTNWRRQGD